MTVTWFTNSEPSKTLDIVIKMFSKQATYEGDNNGVASLSLKAKFLQPKVTKLIQQELTTKIRQLLLPKNQDEYSSTSKIN